VYTIIKSTKIYNDSRFNENEPLFYIIKGGLLHAVYQWDDTRDGKALTTLTGDQVEARGCGAGAN